MNDQEMVRFLAWKETARVGGTWRLAESEDQIKQTMSKEGTLLTYQPRIHEVEMDRSHFKELSRRTLGETEMVGTRERQLEAALATATEELRQLRFDLALEFYDKSDSQITAGAKRTQRWESTAKTQLAQTEGFARTQGPWFIGPTIENGQHGPGVTIVGNEADEVLATVLSQQADPLTLLQDKNSEQAGNLRLILSSGAFEKSISEGLEVVAGHRKVIEDVLERAEGIQARATQALYGGNGMPMQLSGTVGQVSPYAGGVRFQLLENNKPLMIIDALGRIAESLARGENVHVKGHATQEAGRVVFRPETIDREGPIVEKDRGGIEA